LSTVEAATHTCELVAWKLVGIPGCELIANYYCGNFFFYVIGGKLFRKELHNMFFCRQSKGKFSY